MQAVATAGFALNSWAWALPCPPRPLFRAAPEFVAMAQQLRRSCAPVAEERLVSGGRLDPSLTTRPVPVSAQLSLDPPMSFGG